MNDLERVIFSATVAAKAGGGDLILYHPTWPAPDEGALANARIILLDERSAPDSQFGATWLFDFAQARKAAWQVWSAFPVASHLLEITLYCGLSDGPHVIVLTTEARAPFWAALVDPAVEICPPNEQRQPGDLVARGLAAMPFVSESIH